MQSICNPLAKHGVTTFGLTRIYKDNSRFGLCNRPDWIEHYYNQGYVYETRLNRNPDCYQAGAYLWDAWEPTHSGHQLVGNDAALNFNIGRGITILEKTDQWIDKFEFASTPNNYLINGFYLNNLELLHNFVQNFKETSHSLIKEAEKARGIVPYEDNINFYQDGLDTQIPHVEYSNIFWNRNKNKLGKQNATLFNLSSRELDCIHWLLKGKTVPEIAIILEISHRTVEKFILNLKTKLGCHSLFQLGIKINLLGLDNLFRV